MSGGGETIISAHDSGELKVHSSHLMLFSTFSSYETLTGHVPEELL
jgi:hypothetical protein